MKAQKYTKNIRSFKVCHKKKIERADKLIAEELKKSKNACIALKIGVPLCRKEIQSFIKLFPNK